MRAITLRCPNNIFGRIFAGKALSRTGSRQGEINNERLNLLVGVLLAFLSLFLSRLHGLPTSIRHVNEQDK